MTVTPVVHRSPSALTADKKEQKMKIYIHACSVKKTHTQASSFLFLFAVLPPPSLLLSLSVRAHITLLRQTRYNTTLSISISVLSLTFVVCPPIHCLLLLSFLYFQKPFQLVCASLGTFEEASLFAALVMFLYDRIHTSYLSLTVNCYHSLTCFNHFFLMAASVG
jgi:hypothetical protein